MGNDNHEDRDAAAELGPESRADIAALMAREVDPTTRILLIDDDEFVLRAVGRAIRADDVIIESTTDPIDGVERLSQKRFSAVVTDFRMAGLNGLEVCERVRTISPDTPCILLSGHADIQVALSAINRARVFRFLTKPWEHGELKEAVQEACDHNRMVREHRRFSIVLARRNEELHTLNRKLDREVQRRTTELLLGLLNALDLRDTETQGHSRRVALYARRLAEQIDLPREEVTDVERGALLHDIGKIGVSDTILLKPGKLTEEEWVLMRKHAEFGYEILRDIEFLGRARDVVRSHHERFDGKGYPDGLSGDAIPIGARIFAVIDTYDAMTSDRPYRKALPAEVARAEIAKSRESQLDPKCADAFLAIPQPEIDELRDRVAASPVAGLE